MRTLRECVMQMRGARSALCLCALALVFASNARSAECGLSFRQLRAEALEVLGSEFPDERFEAGSEPDVIRMGEAELGLQNLRSALCLAQPMDAVQRRDELVAYFGRIVALTKNSNGAVPTKWGEARELVRLQFMHEDYLRLLAGNNVLVKRPFVPGVYLAVVVDRPNGYTYVREKDRESWHIDEEDLFETALKNVDESHGSPKLQGARGPDPFLASEEKDGYDAVRILLPWVRTEAAKHLGDPFFASIPNRDFLIMWSVANSPSFQQQARQNVSLDFGSQPYKLSPFVLKVWADGRVEVVE